MSQSTAAWRPLEGEEDYHPHCCSDGVVYLGYTVFDEEVGEEAEKIECLPCRRCAEAGRHYVAKS